MQDMLEIAEKINKEGGQLYLVGGAVRDKILNKPTIDEDYCVTGLTVEKFMQLFPQAKIQGKSFPVFILNNKEIALARKERKIGQGHKDFEFNTSSNITIQEDLARRDLTINSIAQNVLTQEIIDPFNGIKDIKSQSLRNTTEAFSEDPLRVYRTARFAATLEFTVEEQTLKAMEKLKPELNTLSKERVFIEFKKALASNKPSIFFEVLKKANVLDVHFKEIYNLIGQIQPEKYHPEGDSYNHTMIVVDKSVNFTNNLAIRYSCLVHDLGKGETPKKILPHHYGHDEKGVKIVNNFSSKIGVPNSWKKCGKTAAKWHMKAGIFEQMTPKKKVELIENVANSMLGLEGMKIVVACDKSRQENIYDKITFDTIGKECLNKINGEFINQKYPNIKGEEFGKKLHQERINWIKKNN
ncbi:MAG: hypothetical protein ACI4UU_05620 [Clostridia bacterium]